MTETAYVDFDILVERAGRKCRARVLASPAGTTGPIEFPVPIRDETLHVFILTVGRPRQGVRRIESPVEQDVRRLGSRLYRSIFQEQIRDCLTASQAEARSQGVGLRLRLHLDVKMADLPWEFLFDEAHDNFLGLSRMTPIVRYLEIDDAPMTLSLDPPLRVLGVISSPPDYPSLDVEGEWKRLEAALSSQMDAGTVQLERLSPVTIDQLLQVLQRGTYHVLHFIGHGGFRQATEEGVLIFEDEHGSSREVTGEELGILLQDHPSLRLVLLNSCEGARGDVRDPFSGSAQSLLRRRIPSVIAMQFEITDSAAIKFSQSFYGALASNFPIDAAVAEARKSVRLTGNAFEWGTPVLYMLSPNGRIFELPKEAERRALEALEQDQAEVDHERAEQERAEQERAEQERAEQERAEQERAEQERAEQERAEHARADRLRGNKIDSRFAILSMVLGVALIAGAVGTWGNTVTTTNRAGEEVTTRLNGFQRSAGLIFAEPPAPKTHENRWYFSMGLVLCIAAAAIVLSALKRRWIIVGVSGMVVVISTVLFIWHFYARAQHHPDTYVTTATHSRMASIGWGEWVALTIGVGIVIAAALASLWTRRRRRTVSGLGLH